MLTLVVYGYTLEINILLFDDYTNYIVVPTT